MFPENCTADELIAKNSKHPDLSMALRLYEAVKGVLLKEGEYYVSQPEVSYFLLVMTPGMVAMVDIEGEENKEENLRMKQRWIVEDAKQTQNVVASFVLEHPDAVFSLEGGEPIYICSGHHWRRCFAFANLKEGMALGYREFGTGVVSSKTLGDKDLCPA